MKIDNIKSKVEQSKAKDEIEDLAQRSATKQAKLHKRVGKGPNDTSSKTAGRLMPWWAETISVVPRTTSVAEFSRILAQSSRERKRTKSFSNTTAR